MDRLRAPFFWLAGLCLLLAVLVEFASVAVMGSAAQSLDLGTPGWGIRYLPLLDLLLLYVVLLMGLGLIAPRAVIGRAQGIVTLILAFFGLLAAVAMIFVALGVLILMVSLLLAVPFGTIAYMVLWGTFPVGEAAATLSLIMVLKLIFCVLLLLAHQRFLQNKGLIILTGVSLGATWVIGFLQTFPPSPLAAITDIIGALVIAVVGAIWLLVLLIGSLFAIIAALRSVRLPS